MRNRDKKRLCCYGDKVDGFTQTFTKCSKSLCESIKAQAKKKFIFFQGEVFFLLTRPLMGDPFFWPNRLRHPGDHRSRRSPRDHQRP